MKKRYTFQKIIKLTQYVIKEFEKKEQKPWKAEGSLIELSKQVGDLARYVMVREKYYLPEREKELNYRGANKDIADELADIFYCVAKLAEHYNIDLEEAIVEEKRNALICLGKKPDF